SDANEACRCDQPDLATAAFLVCSKPSANIAHASQYLNGLAQQQRATRGQGQTFPATAKKLASKVFLKVPHRVADGRFGDHELSGGGFKAPAMSQCDEGLQLAAVDGSVHKSD